jgi:hypothetical protein
VAVSLARDRRVVKRALVAGGVVWAVLAGVLLTFVILGGGSGRAGATVVLLALCFGSATASVWLLLALATDALAGERVGPGRLAWTVATVLFTFVSPMLVLGAQGS